VCLILTFYICQQLSILIVTLTPAIYHAIVTVVKGGMVKGTILRDLVRGLDFGPSYNSVTNTFVSTNTANTFFACLSRLKHCTIAAYNNWLYPGGSYIPTSMLSSRTDTLYAWIESLVMDLRFIRLLVRISSAAALKHCYTTAWSNLSLDGCYDIVYQTRRAAAWYATIEWLTMHYRILAQAVAPSVEVTKSIIGSMRQLIGCALFLFMISGSVCSVWAHGQPDALCRTFDQ
jgi:hypothetical protein